MSLVTDAGDVVLDPFCGSGSFGVAALLEGRRFVGFEREPEFVDTARARCGAAITGAGWNAPSSQKSLF